MTRNRQPAGVPTGGQFAASAKDEAEVSLGAPMPQAADEAMLVLRLDVYERLKDYGVDGTVSTITWPEEPNEDGTFDVDLNVVYDGDGNEVESIGGQGAVAAGSLDPTAPDGYATAFDLWREDPANPASDIDLHKMQAWYAEHRRQVAFARLDELTTTEADGRRWVETEDDFWSAERVRLEAQTVTPYEDLKTNDRFVVERGEGWVECRVLSEPSDTKDRFGRPMKAIMIRRQDNGAEGLHMYGPGGAARQVEQPVHLRINGDPDEIARAHGFRSNEHMLNEAWGV